jgi:hypothetical protein
MIEDQRRYQAADNLKHWTDRVSAARDDPNTSDFMFDCLMAAREQAERAAAAIADEPDV